MRVPDEIRKTVLFIGIKNDIGEWDWKATGYIIAVPNVQLVRKQAAQFRGDSFECVQFQPFRLLATAKHVAEKLEGKDFALRTMTRDGQLRIIEAHADQRWFYHPTDSEHVDSAVTIFFPPALDELDLFTIHTQMFADETVIEQAQLGVGDEVFIAGLFSKVKETTRQNAIIRIGNLAMMPGEKIPFKDGKLIDAYLIECRSIGGLSGSPVFVRETIKMEGYTASGRFYDSGNRPLTNNERIFVDGVGRIFFLGSVIGHWDAPSAFTPTMAEAVNMGIAPVVPAHKILEIICQPELVELAQKISIETHPDKNRTEGEAVLDMDEKRPAFTKEDFENALKQASRKVSPAKGA